MSRQAPRGFTLVELAVVLGILAILGAISITAVMGLKRRSTFADASGALATDLRFSRAEAFSRGNPVTMVVDTAAGRWWVIETPGVFSLTSPAFNPATPAVPPNRLISEGTLPSGVVFGPAATGYGTALPAPFSAVPASPSSSPACASGLCHCSFCDATTLRGAVTWEPGGRVTFSGGAASAIGQQLTLQDGTPGALQRMTFVLNARTGAVTTYEASQ